MAEAFATITGLRELVTALKELPKEIQGKVLGSAVKKEADRIRNAARSKAPEGSGLLKKAIVSYRDKSSTQARIIYNVGVTMKMRQAGEVITASRKKIIAVKKATAAGKFKMRTAFYWRFYEFGTKRQAAKPFLRPAFEENKAAAAEGIGVSLAAAIEKAAAKLGKK